MDSRLTFRIALVDLLFAWPPNGGADVDLYHVAKTLHEQGVSLKLFVLQMEGAEGRGQVISADMPFSVEIVAIPKNKQHYASIAARIRNAVDAWQPDAAFLSHGYALKPHVVLALAHYPLISRYYAHELLCARNALRFKDNAPCPFNYFSHPDVCRPCALAELCSQVKTGQHQAWAQDYLAAEAYTSEYYAIARTALDAMTCIIVSNEQLKQELGEYQHKAVVIPGGIETPNSVPYTDAIKKLADDLKAIYMAGRVDDPLKGLDVLLEASALLKKKRTDFQVVATHFDNRLSNENFVATGWLSHEEALRYYEKADICVVPSLWHEPFGLVAVEAMAAGVPVCASDIGGLRDIVVHNKTGYLFPPGDSAALAGFLDTLLDDRALRTSMGVAGQERALSLYTWDTIVATHYLPLLERILSQSNMNKGVHHDG